MGVHNIKLESEVFQAVPQFQIQGGTPVETKPENGILQQLISQIAQVHVSLNQIHQTLAAQAQWHIPNRTPVETKIDPAVGFNRESAEFRFPNRTPVETKIDPALLHQVAAHLVEAGQAFTRAAEGAVEGQNLVEEVRKLNQRMDEIDSKLPKGREVGGKSV